MPSAGRTISEAPRHLPPPPHLPDDGMLARMLGFDPASTVVGRISRTLVEPARELAARPSKHFRSQLLRFSYALCRPLQAMGDSEAAALAQAEAAIELLHAGSLIIDDIQDGSAQRRGAPSLHLMYGVPEAMCTGNWLYFWPLRLLSQLGLDAAAENAAYRAYHAALEKAHCGQALDVSTKIDQVPPLDVPRLCTAVSELKTGAITALAMEIGALLAGADDSKRQALATFGLRFGTILQHCDDVGNVLGQREPGKRYEDLLLRKPSGVWSLVARLSPAGFAGFRAAAAALPGDELPLQRWLKQHDFAPRAFAAAADDLQAARQELAAAGGFAVDHPVLLQLRDFGHVLTAAYR